MTAFTDLRPSKVETYLKIQNLWGMEDCYPLIGAKNMQLRRRLHPQHPPPPTIRFPVIVAGAGWQLVLYEAKPRA